MVPTAYADYTTRTPSLQGDTVGIFLASGTLAPAQTTSTGIDLVNSPTAYTAYLKTGKSISGTGAILSGLRYFRMSTAGTNSMPANLLDQ